LARSARPLPVHAPDTSTTVAATRPPYSPQARITVPRAEEATWPMVKPARANR